MKIFSKTYYLILLLGGLLCTQCCSAQYPVVSASVDKNQILIGEQLKLSVEAKFVSDDFRVSFPELPDSFAHFEVLSKSKIDSVYAEGKLSGIRQSYTLTSFDSGNWLIPSLKVNITPTIKAASLLLSTDSVPITVSFSVSDSSSQLRDIKPIKGVETESLFWYWVVGAVLFLILVGLLFWYFKKKRKQPADLFNAKLSAYEEAMQELAALQKVNPVDPEKIKLYYTKLTDLLKRYLSRKTNVIHLNKTTSDILVLLHERQLNKEDVFKVATSLRCSDAVKFAKYLPAASENSESLQSIRQIIEAAEKQDFSSTLKE